MLDVSSNRKMLKMLLGNSGAEIDLAVRGKEAVNTIPLNWEAVTLCS